MKKLLILSISLLSLISLSGCRKDDKPVVSSSATPTSEVSSSDNSTSDSKSESSSSNPISNSSEPVSSSSSSPSSSIDLTGKHVVTFYLNLPGDDSVYRTVIVEHGGKIKEFRCVVSTYYGSTWYYDRYGTIPFDFNAPITTDLNLYGYVVPKANNVEMTEYQEDGDFDIKWVNCQDCSFSLVDGGTLPSKANNGDQIKFEMKYSMFTNEKAVIKVNDEIVNPDANGVYTINVTGNTTIESSIKTQTVVDPEKTTYTIDSLPTWITNDGCVIFAWVWGPQVSGEWVKTTYTTETSLTFTYDKTLTGLLLARCAPGTEKPDWNMTTDGPGRVYNQTTDMAVIPGDTTYSLPETTWKPYN